MPTISGRKVGITNGILSQTVKTLQSIIIESIGINFACVNLTDSGGCFLNRFEKRAELAPKLAHWLAHTDAKTLS